MKKNRHEEILSLIANADIDTQEELAEALKAAGHVVTQATVSRDIRELNITKIIGENGKQKYVSFADMTRHENNRITRLIKDAVISADCAGNMLVIKTRNGMGMAAAVVIDEMEKPEILGTIAGDDVVFCAVRSVEQAECLKEHFMSIVGVCR